ncbi:MAG: FGGY-family carbohydrate kinase [Candidatus Caldatribacteriaceae bacterium]
MDFLLGMDVGTTNTKIQISDREGRVRAEKSFPTPLAKERGEQFYSPVGIARRILETIASFDKSILKGVRALSVSSFAEVMVGIGDEGWVLTHSIPWYSECTQPQFERVYLDPEEVFRVTGLSPQPKYSFYKLLWHRENEPELYSRVRFWTSMSGFLLYYLSGELSFDYSLASRTMLFDQKNRTWWEEMCEKVGISSQKLAPLCPSGKVLGKIRRELAEETGLSPEALVVTGGHDHLCAALASGVYQPGWVLISSGTTESIMVTLEDIPQRIVWGDEKPFSFGHHVVFPRYYAMNGIYSGGYAVDWVTKIFQENYEVFRNLPLSLSSKTPLFFPYLLGGYYEGARGAFLSLSGKTERKDLLLGVLLGLCLEYRHLFEMVIGTLNFRVKRVVNVGGGTKNRAWMQLKSTMLSQEILVPEDREGSCKGAALLAGLGAGLYRDLEEMFSSTFRVQETFSPSENKGEMDGWFSLYEELRKDLKIMNQKIFRFLQ